MQQKNICLPLCPLLAFPPHLSFMPLFFGSLSSCCLHLLLCPLSLSLFHSASLFFFVTHFQESLICFLWSASVFRDALSIAASLSHQPLVSLDFGSLPKHFFFRSASVLCYCALVLCLHCLRCCSLSMQAHASLTGCCQGEAAAVCVR